MIEVITTGGTFDKVYKEEEGQLSFPKNSFINEIIETARVTQPFTHTPFTAIDSLDMTDSHRESLSTQISQSKHSQIVITHGTDTMPETAQFLRHKQFNKTIVICGAMRPYSLGKSDASFNLGFALGVVQLLPVGIYVAMNGKIFEKGVKKNKLLGLFEH